MGLKDEGFDIDKVMCNRVRINLKYFKITPIKIEQADATNLNEDWDYVVTDLPYGKLSKVGTKTVQEIFEKFVGVLEKHLKKRAVVGIPDWLEYKKIIKDSKLKLENEFNYYLHRSFSKRILVLRKQ